MIRLLAAMALAAGLAGCTAGPSSTASRAQTGMAPLPEMKVFDTARPSPPAISNAQLADDFLALHFELESGRPLPVLTRVEGPISVRVTGRKPPTLDADLRRLLVRLRSEAGLDIRLTDAPDATVTIEVVSRAQIQRVLPQAACFVVPNVTSLAEFRRDRRKDSSNWALLRERSRLAIFLPYDTTPQETRDCLHEELAQAIGPLNDLYRLPDSVFNDDNVHTVLTGYDMLILRTTYAPELQSGMSRDEVAARLPKILAQLNPGGQTGGTAHTGETPRAWIDAVQTALGPGTGMTARRNAADTALRIATRQGWTDHRRAFSHYIAGHLSQANDPLTAQAQFQLALDFLEGSRTTRLHRAHVVAQTAAYDILRGDGGAALAQIEPSLPVAAASENAALLATLMLLKAEALALEGRPEEARQVRLDSLGWARYGFGSDAAVRAKMTEIAALNPMRRNGQST
jgi:hypothetical protein